MDPKYKEVIEANIALHSTMASDYSTCEPHFRPENIEKVSSNIRTVIEQTKAESMLDLGCGTGFLIHIAKPFLKNITGVDVTQPMLDRVDVSGDSKITLVNHDTGSFPVEESAFDMVTAYSFLHHLYDIRPTVATAYKALKKGGVFYADLDPNFYFWDSINQLDRHGNYDAIVKREIEMVTYKDEDIEKNFGVAKDVFNNAEYGKNIAGGFKEEDLRNALIEAGFSDVKIVYHWYLGQAYMINSSPYERDERFAHAAATDEVLQKLWPLSRHLYKYLGFYATK